MDQGGRAVTATAVAPVPAEACRGGHEKPTGTCTACARGRATAAGAAGARARGRVSSASVPVPEQLLPVPAVDVVIHGCNAAWRSVDSTAQRRVLLLLAASASKRRARAACTVAGRPRRNGQGLECARLLRKPLTVAAHLLAQRRHARHLRVHCAAVGLQAAPHGFHLAQPGIHGRFLGCQLVLLRLRCCVRLLVARRVREAEGKRCSGRAASDACTCTILCGG